MNQIQDWALALLKLTLDGGTQKDVEEFLVDFADFVRHSEENSIEEEE